MKKKTKEQIGIAVGVLTGVGGLEHVAQAAGSTLLTLPILSLVPALVQGVAGIAGLYAAYMMLGGKKR